MKLYRESHAFVHVSFTEGVPKVLVEALAAGLPIVATNVGGVGSILDEGEPGCSSRPLTWKPSWQPLRESQTTAS